MSGAKLEGFTTGVLPAGLPFCSAMRVGDLVFLSGNIGNVEGTIDLVSGGVAAETTQCLAHMRKGLEAAGSSAGRVIKCTVFLTDIGDFQAMNEAYAAFFDGHQPTRSTVEVKGLAAGAHVEIECIAAAG